MKRIYKPHNPLPRKPGWRDVPDEFWTQVEPLLPPGSVAHAHFQAWDRAGVFARLWQLCLKEYDLKGIDWRWQTVDSATVPAPVKGGILQGKIPPIEANWGPNLTFTSTPMVST